MANQIATYIDHTMLKAEVSKDNIKVLCQEAIEHKFAAVCVNPSWVTYAKEMLKDSPVSIATVVGFPLGATTTATKVFEAKEAAQNGATEIDMVISIGKVKDKEYTYVEQDIREVVNAVKSKAIVKVIIETSLLTTEEKVNACKAAVNAGADFVKTSTGFSSGGATVEDVKLMRDTVGPNIGVKASGGVRDLKTAIEMIENGATRIGTSSGVSIVKGISGLEEY